MIESKDPVAGLVAFAQDIKPYHTKIIEVLVDYVHEENMKVRFTEDFSMGITTTYDFHDGFCPEGFGLQPWGELYSRRLNRTVDILTEVPVGYIWIVLESNNDLINVPNHGYIFSVDKQWILLTNIVFGGGGPPTGSFTPGTYYFDTTENKLYVYNNLVWEEKISSSYFVGFSDDIIPQCNNDGYYRPGVLVSNNSNPVVCKKVLSILPPNVLMIEGNHLDKFSPGDVLTIIGSFGNDGNWRVTEAPYPTSVMLHDENQQQYIVPATAVTVEFIPTLVAFIENILVQKVLSKPSSDLLQHCGITIDSNTGKVTQIDTGEVFDNIKDWSLAKLFPVSPQSLPCLEFLFFEEIQHFYNISSSDLLTNYGIEIIEMTWDGTIDESWSEDSGWGDYWGGDVINPSFRVFVYKKITTGETEQYILIETYESVAEWYFNRIIPSSITNLSNYDFPQSCPITSPTTLYPRFKERINFDVALPVSIFAKIVSVEPSTSTSNGYFEIQNPEPNNISRINNFGSSDYRSSFPPSSQFEIQGSGNNNGIWTVKNSLFTGSTTRIYPIETIPRYIVDNDPPAPVADIVEPYGYIVVNLAEFKEKLMTRFIESSLDSSWESYYYSAPTTQIKSISPSSITVHGDLRRYYRPGSRLTVYGCKVYNPSTNQYRNINIGAWIWEVTGCSYDSSSDSTTIIIDRTLDLPDIGESFVSFGFVSGQPTVIRGIGWGIGGWSPEPFPWITIVDEQLLQGDNFIANNNYNLFTIPQGAFDNARFDLGGFEDILQQILPL